MRLTDFSVGQHVTAVRNLGDSPSGDSPGGCYAREGEVLVVRHVGDQGEAFPISVSHEGVTDRSFGVTASEVSPL